MTEPSTHSDERPEPIIIRSMDEIPSHFPTEADEAAYWYTHELSDELLDLRVVNEPPAWLQRLRSKRSTKAS